jgi:NAD(P)H dehydrogenase (quinone)
VSPTRRTYVVNALGLPQPVADMLLGMFAASRAGEFAAVDPTLEQLLGRPPLTVREVLAKG